MNSLLSLIFFFFFFNDTATTEIYTLSLHDALRSLAGRVVAAAGAEAQRHRDHGLLVMLDDDELQAVRERDLLERRKARREERSRLGRLGREGLGGQADSRIAG